MSKPNQDQMAMVKGSDGCGHGFRITDDGTWAGKPLCGADVTGVVGEAGLQDEDPMCQGCVVLVTRWAQGEEV